RADLEAGADWCSRRRRRRWGRCRVARRHRLGARDARRHGSRDRDGSGLAMTELFTLTVAGAGAWAMRASAIVLVGNRPVPEAAVRALGYAKHAVLAALVGAALTSSGNCSALWLVTPQGVAAVAAGA